MVRKTLQAGVFAALGLVAMMVSHSMASSADDKDPPEVSAIMSKSFGKKDSFKASLPAAVKAEKWEDAQKLAKEFSELGACLGKNKPPKGEQKSWDDLTKKFADDTKAVYDATDKKDAKAFGTAMGAIGKSCGTCHKAHKP